MKKVRNLADSQGTGVIAPRFGLGMEMLDRSCFEPDPAYDDVAAVGAKWTRIQSGWTRCEKIMGQYDFEWLDDIVDNLNARGLAPWLCLCYANGLYCDAVINGSKLAGGPPIHSEEMRAAWVRYVKATAAHFKGRIAFYEIWNEPDGIWCWKHGVNGFEYGEFGIMTAKAIKEVDPDAKIAGASMCLGNPIWLAQVLSTGFGNDMDYLTFHCYAVDIDNTAESFYNKIHAVMKQYNCKAEIIQGETGCASQSKTSGALSWLEWTEEKQAKYLLRLLLTNVKCGVKFTSWFKAVTKYDKNRFRYGLIQEDWDEASGAYVYNKVKGYQVMKNLCNVFRGEFTTEELPISLAPESDIVIGPGSSAQPAPVKTASFRLADGRKAFAYWKSTEPNTTSYDGRINIQVAGLMGQPQFIDMMTGDVFDIDAQEYAGDLIDRNSGSKAGTVWLPLPMDMAEKYGLWNLELPLRDYPLLLVYPAQ